MRQPIVVVFVVAGMLTALGVLLGPSLFGDGAPVLKWDAKGEVAVAPQSGDVEPEGAESPSGAEREQVSTDGDVERTAVTLRGRVVDKHKGPVRDAQVWLDFARGGPRAGGAGRRVVAPVRTDNDGQFAFAGQVFKNLRVTLLVADRLHAAKTFERNLGEVQGVTDVGDLMVDDGGELFGRVTDLDANAVPDAEVKLNPESDNRMRFQRERDSVLPPLKVDNNGFYRFEHVPSGQWSVGALAPHHTAGASGIVTSVENTRVDVEDIRLGPGYELAGIVSDVGGKPIEGAEVVARATRAPDPANGRNGQGANATAPTGPQPPNAQGRNGRNGRGFGPGGPGGNNDHRTRTDAQGQFVLEHLPGAPLEVTIDKEGYLRWQRSDIDAKLGQRLFVTMQDGLKITGTVTDAATKATVDKFSVEAVRVRGLPKPGETPVDAADLMQRFRNGTLDAESMAAARDSMRSSFDGMRGMFGGGRGGGGGRSRARIERHPGGRFTASGLQEGVYAVQIGSDDYAQFRSAEVEVRVASAPPDLTIGLVRGVAVRGVVTDKQGAPVGNATVELRLAEVATPDTADASAGSGRGNRGNRGGRGGSDPIRTFIANFGASQIDTTTDAKGRFVFAHSNPENYRLVAQKDGYDEARSDPFELSSDRDGFVLKLGALGAIAGHILGATPEQIAEVRVLAMSAGNGNGNGGGGGARFRGPGGQGGQGGGPGGGMPFGVVQPDGSYRISDLQPGGYAVRAFVGNGMRSLWSQFGSDLKADVAVRAGETTAFDVQLMVPQTGTVAGSVTHNGQPAAGFQVTLHRQDDGSNADPNANGGDPQAARGGRGGRGRGNGDQQAAVDSSGRFTMHDVPAGIYQLTVTSGRRAGPLHTEAVVVSTGATSEVAISLATCALDGLVTVDDNSNVAELQGMVLLLPGATEIPNNLANVWRDGSAFTARVQGGKFTLEMLPPGNYLAVLAPSGREQTSAPVFMTLGERTQLTIAAGKHTEGDANALPGNRRGGRSGRGANGGANAPTPNGSVPNGAAPNGAGNPQSPGGGPRRGGGNAPGGNRSRRQG
jgi:hypothetical protein